MSKNKNGRKKKNGNGVQQATAVLEPADVKGAPTVKESVPSIDKLKKPVFGKEQVDLIKRTIAKGATDDELKMFLAVCSRKNLDPFSKQIYFVRRYSKRDNQYIGAIQTSVDGLRAIAQRTGEYAGQDEAELEFDGKNKREPVLARVRIYKKGIDRPTVGIAYWDEFAPIDMNGEGAFFWRRMPRHMLAKCAEALGLRKAFPEELGDLYTEEEMHQSWDEIPETVASVPTAALPAAAGATAEVSGAGAGSTSPPASGESVSKPKAPAPDKKTKSEVKESKTGFKPAEGGRPERVNHIKRHLGLYGATPPDYLVEMFILSMDKPVSANVRRNGTVDTRLLKEAFQSLSEEEKEKRVDSLEGIVSEATKREPLLNWMRDRVKHTYGG